MGDRLFPLATTGEYCVDNSLNPTHFDVIDLLKRHGLQPEKKLGQNFLIEPRYLERVVEAGMIGKNDTILEIGAGLGNLTCLLGMQAKEVFAVELDQDFIPILEETTRSFQNIHIIQGDILKIDLENVIQISNYLVVANIPYYITSNLIQKLLSTERQPARIVLTIQKEVAERICAEPGRLSLLGLSVQVYGHPQILSKIPAGAFYPAPKVDSAIIRIEPYPDPIIPAGTLPSFFRLARAGFSQKRKTLRNSLAAGLHQDKSSVEKLLADAGINPMRRAETLNLNEWAALTEIFEKQPPEF